MTSDNLTNNREQKGKEMKLRHLTFVSAMALSAGVMSQAAIAQDAEPDEVIATGIRQSLTEAADFKRAADGVVDAITAEDIGKFPDTNLAESLQRITGVSIDRANGEGQQISVRGFGPGFNMVTLNGRQMPTAASPKQEGADTNAQVRAFNFAEISADSVANVKVYKTGRADLPTGGIGATVDVETARPLGLDVGDYVLAGAVKANFDTSNVEGSDITPEFTGIIGKHWGTASGASFGLMFNGSYSERDSREEVVSTDGWLRNDPAANAAFAGNVDASGVGAGAVPGIVFSPRNLVTDISDHERKRTNAQFVAQFAPNDSLTATLDYTYSDYKDRIDRAQTAVWFDQNLVQGVADANGTLTNPTIVSDGANFGALDFNSYADEVQTTNKSIGVNLDWQATDNLNLNFDFHDSESDAQPDGQSSDFLGIISGPIGVSYSADYNTGSDVPILALNPAAGIDPYNLAGLRGNINLQRGNLQTNEIQQFQLKGKWENSDGSSIKSVDFGAGYLDYKVDTSFSFDLDVYNGGVSCGAACNDFVTVSPRDSDYGGSLSGTNTLPEFFLQYPSDGLETFLAGVGAANVFELVTPVENQIQEETYSAYFNVNFEDDFNGMPLKANAGVRYETTDTEGTSVGPVYDALTWISSTELRAASSSNAEQTLAGDYDVFLPNINLSIEPNETVVLRASYGRSLSRPDLNLLRPNLGITDTRPGGPYQATAGNPALLPYVSDNIDVSAEWYYNEGSYISVAAFKKFVDNYITSGVRQSPIFSDALGCNLTDPSTPGVNPPVAVNGACGDAEVLFDITSFVNGETASVQGVELAVQHLFGESGFGLQANATFVDGDTEFDPSTLDQAVALTGLSNSANLVGFYDKNGLQARIAYNWRDEFLLATNQLRQPGEPVFIDAFGQVDASVSYEVNDKFTVFGEGINIFDETATAHGRFDNQFLFAYHGGPRYALGVRAKF